MLLQSRHPAPTLGVSLKKRQTWPVKQRDNIFVHGLDAAGRQPYAKVTTEHIIAGKERRAKTPSRARNFLDAMRGLFRWALMQS
jgi:hypothetical protein